MEFQDKSNSAESTTEVANSNPLLNLQKQSNQYHRPKEQEDKKTEKRND